MKTEIVQTVLQSPTAENVQALLDDESSVFWIESEQDDETIAAACETVLKTGKLSAELVDVYSSVGGYDVYVQYGDRRLRVPLTFSPADRHLTLRTLNEAMAPDYEIRFCVASKSNDTLGFLPLPTGVWNDLTREYGKDQLARHFYEISSEPNLFTEPLPF